MRAGTIRDRKSMNACHLGTLLNFLVDVRHLGDQEVDKEYGGKKRVGEQQHGHQSCRGSQLFVDIVDIEISQQRPEGEEELWANRTWGWASSQNGAHGGRRINDTLGGGREHRHGGGTGRLKTSAFVTPAGFNVVNAMPKATA
jgi:hypothetical protein